MIITVHCAVEGTPSIVRTLCGRVIPRQSQEMAYNMFISAKDLAEEKDFKRSWIRCGKCLSHEDFPLLVLGELDEDELKCHEGLPLRGFHI